MKFKMDVLSTIKNLNPEYLFIVTNQGGIEKGLLMKNFLDQNFNIFVLQLKNTVNANVMGYIVHQMINHTNTESQIL